MIDPERLRWAKTLTTILEEITVANGYQHDMGGKVFRGRTVFSDNDYPIPMISILEEPIPEEQVPSPPGMNTGPWRLMIQGFVKDDKDNPTDPAHHLLADTKKRLAIEAKKQDARRNEDAILGDKSVVSMSIGPGVVRPPDEISAKAYFWLSLELTVAEDQSDPYGS